MAFHWLVPASRSAFPALAPGLPLLAGARAPVRGSGRDAAVVELVQAEHRQGPGGAKRPGARRGSRLGPRCGHPGRRAPSGRSVHRRGRWRAPVLPARVHRDQPRRAGRDADQLRPRIQGQVGRNRLPPPLAGEQPAEQLWRPAPGSEDELGGDRKAGSASASIELTARGWIDGMPRSSIHPPACRRARTASPAARTSPTGSRRRKNRYPSTARRRRNPSGSSTRAAESANSSTRSR
jgi:hypothetical protein